METRKCQHDDSELHVEVSMAACGRIAGRNMH